MLRGAHFIIYSQDPDADRAFFRDVLGLASVDAGHGWLIFRLPNAEAALHPAGPAPGNPADGPAMATAELYWMCDDLDATMADLAERGVRFSAVTQERWGRRTALRLPSGAELGLYQPAHPTALGL
jgi:catechol 2,3-dioxygenase-like lactoylglutathione lyase family enzyme